MAVPVGPGGVGVALSALFKQRIGAFLGSISWVHFPGYGAQTQETRYKRAAGWRNRALHALRALWSAFLRHFYASRWASRSVSGLSTRAGPPSPPADSARAHRTEGSDVEQRCHAIFIWFISALLLDQQALVATARSAIQHMASHMASENGSS